MAWHWKTAIGTLSNQDEFVDDDERRLVRKILKQASVHARKSREGEIFIESTRREGAKIMNKPHLLESSFVLFG